MIRVILDKNSTRYSLKDPFFVSANQLMCAHANPSVVVEAVATLPNLTYLDVYDESNRGETRPQRLALAGTQLKRVAIRSAKYSVPSLPDTLQTLHIHEAANDVFIHATKGVLTSLSISYLESSAAGNYLNMTRLQRLDIRDLNRSAVQPIIDALADNMTLRKVSLNYDRVGGKGGPDLSRLPFNPIIQSLKLCSENHVFNAEDSKERIISVLLAKCNKLPGELWRELAALLFV
jgi:hypothetical protein